MRYALVHDGVVTNIISLNRRNASDFPNAAPCEDAPVSIGDTYDGKAFYRDGKRVMSAAEEYAEALNILLGEV